VTAAPRVGLSVFSAELAALTPPDRRAVLAEAAAAGIDYLHVGDHVTFHGGYGWDGLINAAALLSLQDSLPVMLGIYQLPLRHPTLVARQLATISESHPGRLIFGVGVGGDDPREMLACGVDPRTRGRRMNEALHILRGLRTGQPVTFSGQLFEIEEVTIEPAVPDLPILVGGRSDAALRRAGRFGDGWAGIWISPARFGVAVQRVVAEAQAVGRSVATWEHNLTLWCGLGSDRNQASRALADAMSSIYRLDPKVFSRWSPAGPPEAIAEFIHPYVEAAARSVSVIGRGQNISSTIESVAEVRRLLAQAYPVPSVTTAHG
jgi:alkanesulfonate monooxygenase SsuD/methylene tetrahydromethanopterin reductase-like flavin-dependent oxidoreductase (luciferase family)